ncbi:hypothetical protein ACLPHM_16180 [Paenalcaligenes sp. Me131]|uniref:hypothetical protein n=1 Tax=Paenalcaligenes sp. Me131 TaxID=3392636 RepID=UPI003D2E0DC2
MSNTVTLQTYAQWSECLELLATGNHDEACLMSMSQGSLALVGGVVSLFSKRLAEEFNTRLSRCSDLLTRDLQRSSDESGVVRAILNARKSLAFLHRLAHVQSFPETLRTHLSDEVRKFAQRAQTSLEDSAKTDRTGRLAVVLRNNNLSRYESSVIESSIERTTVTPATLSSNTTPLSGGIRRRNILS